MSRESLIFLLGILVVLTPFLGIPSSAKTYMSIALGTLIMFLAFLLRRAAYLRAHEKDNGEVHTEAFHESGRRKADTAMKAMRASRMSS